MKKTIEKQNQTICDERIAIISDIHGNMPALLKVLDDIEQRKIKKIYCLGDLAGKGPLSAEAVDVIKLKCEKVVLGNWDYFLSECEGSEVIQWYQKQLGKERLQYFKQLPFYIEFYLSGKFVRLCHASPNDVFHRVYKQAAYEEKMELFQPTDENGKVCDILGYGDIHGAFVEYFYGKTLFNVGSVGNPLDGIHASYAILDGKLDSQEQAAFGISIIKVPYDVEEAIKQVQKSSLPEKEDYIGELKTGIYRGLRNKTCKK